MLDLNENQKDAVMRMKNGCILCGGTGSGKTRTALAYYDIHGHGKYLYVITTAKKRDSGDWEEEMKPLGLSSESFTVDSWNNILKYKDVRHAFFIFDEQRAVRYGPWGRTFVRIARNNSWIMLSATPGDKWLDYLPVFLAHGYFHSKTEFERKHVVYKPFRNYPEVDHYENKGYLLKLRREILVDLDAVRSTVRHDETVWVNYDKDKYRKVARERIDIWSGEPITTASGLCGCLRRITNSDESRYAAVLEIMERHPRVIIFYSFNYELAILRSLCYPDGTKIAEWNGHKHEDIPDSDRWVYLVNYIGGAEGWNCILTDTIIFFSQTYSYKTLEQARGRIDRLNTPYIDLWYYHLRSRSGIDLAISEALQQKAEFNERKYIYEHKKTGI